MMVRHVEYFFRGVYFPVTYHVLIGTILNSKNIVQNKNKRRFPQKKFTNK